MEIVILFPWQRMYETISCTGKETNLQSCIWTERQNNYVCKHYSDAGVKCNVPTRQRKKMKVCVCEPSPPLHKMSSYYTDFVPTIFRS